MENKEFFSWLKCDDWYYWYIIPRHQHDDVQGCPSSPPKCKVFRFHETILRSWARIPRENAHLQWTVFKRLTVFPVAKKSDKRMRLFQVSYSHEVFRSHPCVEKLVSRFVSRSFPCVMPTLVYYIEMRCKRAVFFSFLFGASLMRSWKNT